MVKIAAVSNNGKSISAHFGKARYFVVVEVEDGKIVGREVIDRESIPETPGLPQIQSSGRSLNVINTVSGHDHHDEKHHDGKHEGGVMKRHNLEPITGCKVVLSRGMGNGMLQRLNNNNMEAILTNIVSIDEAVNMYLEGNLQNHPELVH
jgi:predicted Fe-Mo cluster-binding NifX family protein